MLGSIILTMAGPEKQDTLLTQGVTVEYGVSVSTDPSDWVDLEARVDDPLIAFRFQLGTDDWTPRYVVPVFGAISMIASLVHQLIENGHHELALDLFRESDGRSEQAAVLSLLQSGMERRDDFTREISYPQDEPTLDLIRATNAIIQMVCSGNKDAAAQAIEAISTANGLEPLTRFMALMAGRAIGYIAMMTHMDQDSVLHVLAGAALFESQADDDE